MTFQTAAVDDGSVAMRGAIEVLRAYAAFEFSAVFPSVRELSLAADGDQRTPNTVLLCDPFANGDGLADLALLPRSYAVLVMSCEANANAVRQALGAGVRGYLPKDVEVSVLIDAVSAVGVGGLYLSGVLDAIVVEQFTSTSLSTAAVLEALTPRERDVLAMIAQGLTHKQIGTSLNLSKATVDTYVHRVRQKAGAVNKAGLTRLAIDLGLLSPG